jgi:hypothetical protein
MANALYAFKIPTFFNEHNELNDHNDPNTLIEYLNVTFSWRLFLDSRDGFLLPNYESPIWGQGM